MLKEDLQNSTGNPNEHSHTNLDMQIVYRRLDTHSGVPESICCFFTTHTTWEIHCIRKYTLSCALNGSQLYLPQASVTRAVAPSLEPELPLVPGLHHPGAEGAEKDVPANEPQPDLSCLSLLHKTTISRPELALQN